MASSSTRFRCQLRADAKKDEAELLIYDEIGKSFWGDGVDAKSVLTELANVTAKKIRVRINSAGGDVFEGLAIYNALRTHDAKVVVEIDSLAASIASIIALAGEEVKIADNAFFMIHNPHGMAFGGADEMRDMAALLDKVGGSLVAIYVEHSGKDADEVQAWMDAETWFTAAEAKEAGFVTAITKGKAIAARADLSVFGHAPASLIRAAAVPETQEPNVVGGTTPDEPVAPAQPAPAAQGEPMSVVDTAAQATGAEAEKTRAKQIRALGREHKIEASVVDGWLDNDQTIASVKDAILEQIKAKAAVTPPSPRSAVGKPRAENDPRRGFETHRDFLLAVMENRGQTRDSVRDERLRPLLIADDEGQGAEGGAVFMLPGAFTPRSIRATAGSDEQGTYSDPYGGFLQTTQVVPGMLSIKPETDPTVGRVTAVPMASPIVKFNARTDKDHSTSVSGGLTFTRTPETAAATASRMQMEQVTMEASPLVGLAYATEAIMTDSPISFASLLASGFDDQRAYHILNEKIVGIGGSQYQGVLGAACTVSVAKETNQVAATIVGANIIKMAARVWGLDQAIWLANHNCRPQLATASIAIGTAGTLLYQPSEREGFPDMLWGRPIFYTEFCKTVGTVGDIILGNWSQYLEGVYQPMRADESIHVRFLNLERTFRFYERNCGSPWWRSALTPKNGSTLSPFVTLDTRA